MTPDQLRALFDANGILISFIVGIVIKYVPAFARVTNSAIGWVNVALYLLGTYLTPQAAHAAGLGGLVHAIPDLGCVIIGSLTTSMWARTAYETLGRPLLEQVFKLKKAVPA